MLQHPDKARKYLTIAQEQLQTLSGLVEQILSMSMERRKSMLLNIVEVPMKEVIEPLISQHQLKVKSGEKRIKGEYFVVRRTGKSDGSCRPDAFLKHREQSHRQCHQVF